MAMKTTTEIAYQWALRSFGADHVNNVPVRSLRLAEEAVELAQAAGVTKEKMQALVDVVYSRPVGEIDQEIGGVLMTATVLCALFHTDPEWFFDQELKRVLAKPPEHFTKRNEEKIALGLDA